MFSVFIVDDEKSAQNNLIDSLQHHSNWQVKDVFSSGEELLDAVQANKPDVVFLDIKMPGSNGLVIAKQLISLGKPPLIVFVTAFSEFALQAFELYAVDYLLKPFDDERIAMCIKKLEATLSSSSLYDGMQEAQSAWANTKPLKQIIIKSSASIRIIPTEDIEWLGANGNYVDIHHKGQKHLLRGSLKNVLSYLPEKTFVQIHRGYALRFSMIREIKTLDDDKSVVVLSNNTELPLGKSFKPMLVDALLNK